MQFKFIKIKKSNMLFAMLSVMLAFSGNVMAQLTGTKNIPGDYASLALAITDLNTVGVGAGGVTLNLLAGNPETAPAGGYSITANGVAANQISIIGNGNTITASATQSVGALNDAVFKIIGGDYITLSGFTIQENAANTATTVASNNMTEFGIALFYASVTDGSQNITIQNNTISLNRAYANTFGIYSNSTHNLAAVTTASTATGATGGTSNLKIVTNTISNVNMAIVVVGPTAASDYNQGLNIGGTSVAQGNTITNYGTTGTFSGYANVSTTVNGILVRNTGNYNISFNSVTSSVGGNIAGTIRGIYVPAFSNTPTGALVQTVNNNTVSVKSAVAAGVINGITIEGTTSSTTSSVTINNNDFNNFGHTVAASGTIVFITSTPGCGTLTVNNNTFSNINVNTTGSVTFVSHGYSMVLGAAQIFNNNSIVGTFNKTGGGGTITGFTSGTSSVNGSFSTQTNNNLSNITVTGATAITGITNSDGAGTSPNRTVTGNVFTNWTGGTSSILGFSYSYIGANTTISNNLFSNITGQAAITGISVGSSFSGGNPLTVANNTISSLSSTGTGGAVVGITSSNTSPIVNINNNIINTLSSTAGSTIRGIVNSGSTLTNIFKNKIYDLSGSNASSVVNGILISGGTTNNVYNNLVGDLRTPIASAAEAIIGISLTGGTTDNIHYNSVFLNATSSGTNFGSSAVSSTAGPGTINLRNNIFVNNSTPMGTGIAVAQRRSAAALTNYGTASNNNLYYAGTPSATTAIFYDGTTVQQTLANFKTFVGASREAVSVTENPSFASTTGSAANFLHFNAATSSLAESGAANIATYTDDYDGDIRQGNAGYAGTGTSPDMGADEFSGTSPAPAINSVSITPTGTSCTAVLHNVTTNVTPGSLPLTSVVLSYAFNGVAQPTVALTGGNVSATSNWTGSIPVASPSNANVTWFVTTTDGTYTKIMNGTSYKDEPLLGASVIATVTPNPVCAGSSVTLSPVFSSTVAAAYALPPAVTNPTSDEDFGSIVFGPLANTTTTNSLIGTIGTASGVAGSYSDFTAFGPYNFTAGNVYNLTVGSITTGTSYNNAFGVYIDYNRNGVFTDPGEAVYISTVTVSGPHTENASITIPATAKNGLTRMRVINNEGLVSGPAMTVAYGEYEDYMLNITSANVGGGLIPSFSSYAWSNGVSTVATTSTTVQSPAGNTTYSITATDVNGCSISSAPLAVTVTPLPAAPTVTNSSQCGNGQPTAMVGGGSLYNWYATPTSTTVLQSSASPFYAVSISTTTTFYVASAVGTCESSRTALMASVTQPDGVTATTTAANICPAGSVTLTAVQSGTNNPYTFSWVASPVSGSGLSSSVPGQSIAVSPTAPGTYAYNVTATDGICTTTAVVNVTLNNPPVINATANPTVICSGASVSLNATTPVIAAGTRTVGAGSTTSSSGGSPFYHGWGGAKVQYIYTAAELTAQGIAPGNITAMALNVTAVGIPYEGFAINAGTTTQSAFAAANTINGLTQVFLGSGVNNSYLPTVGVNTFNFSTPINWNGTDNLVISICWSNATTGGSSSTVKWDTYATNVGMYIYSDSQTPSTVCSATTTIPASGGSSTTTGRPQTSFTGLTSTSGAGPLTWQWNPGAINSNTATVNPVNTGTVAATQVYTITGTNGSTTCSNTATVSVLVNPLPATPTAFNSSQCGLGIPTASVTGGTTYKWYATPTATTALQTSTSATYTTAINATTNFYVASYNGTCESVRALVTASVTIPDGVTASSTSTAVCPGSTFTLTATKSGTVNTYAYTWTASPASGSGIPTSATGATTAVTPTTPGTYGYLVTAVDGVCTTTASINVTLNAPPNITNAMATPTMVCSGSTVGLSAISVNALAGNAATGLQSTTSITGGPYRQGAGTDNKAQYLFTAAELTAAGFAPGNFTALSFSVTSNGTGTMNNFTIKMGNTASTSLNTAYDAAPPVVFGPVAYTTVAGLNTHTFATPFNWNGISNVIIEVCHDVVSSGGSSTIGQETISNRTIYSNTTGACALTTGNANTIRPIITFAAQVGTNVSSSINFVWNPGSIPTNTAVVTPINTGTAAVNQIYTVTATNPATGCTNTATTSVIVNPIPVSPVAFNSTQCGVAIPTASVTGGTSYNWYATPTATNAIQTGTSQTYTSSISTATNFYVTSFNGNCESPRVTVTASVTIPDALTASVGTASICPSTTVALLSTKTGTANTYAYTWTGSPVAGSGIPTSVSGSSVIITPTLSGTYVYTITGVDAGCTAIATTTLVTYSALTTPPLTSALPNPICVGASATLSATFGNTTSPVYVAPPAVTYPTSDEDLGYISFGPLANTTNTNSLVGTIGTASGTAGSYSDFTAFGPYSYIKGNTYTLTVGSITTGTYYSNAFGVYIDYNRNGVFTDAGEDVYLSSATVSGPHTETVAITIPSSASTGITRMRVISNEGLVTGPTMSVFYGEFEEYTLNLQPNITYNWTDGASSVGTTNPLTVTPVSNTTYSFTAVDGNGCTINSTAVTVTVNPLPTVTAAASSTTSCAASSVTLTTSGATTYSWMPAGGTATTAVVSPTTSTIYTVTGTALGCSSTKTVAISVTPNPTVVATISPSVICAGATVSLTATGATSYTWSPISVTSATAIASPTINTTYSVTGSSLGCNNTKTVNVVVNNVPTLTITTNPASGILCTVGSVGILSATGTGTAYVWSNGPTTSTNVVTPTSTTNYTVTATNTCGTSTTVATMSVGVTPTLTATSSASLICSGNPVVLTASGTSGIAYSWNTGATTTSISVTPTTTTAYTVTGSNACGTATAVVTQSVSPCTGIEEVYGTSGISIYPNPANDHVNVEISSNLVSNHTTVEITDALGKLVMQETLGTEVTRINISKLEDGVYFFKVSTNNQTVKVGKVVKQ